MLVTTVQAEDAGAAEPVDRLVAAARGYVRFAADQRPLFETAFGSGLDRAQHPELDAASQPLKDAFQAAALQLSGGDRTAATARWSPAAPSCPPRRPAPRSDAVGERRYADCVSAAPVAPPARGVFDDLVGQEAAVAELRATVSSAADVLAGSDNRGMTHAWLFTGPPGSGRSTAARAFAAALQCERGGCGACESCRTVLGGTHADVEVVRPEGLSFSVAEARLLVHRAAMSPAGRRWQVVLFEDADRMTEQAANALLKAIEEPPPRTVWLLCTPAPDDLVVTIRSRCRLVTLRTPSTAAVTEVLVNRDGVAPEMAAFAARVAQGHVGRARRLATDETSRARRAEVLRVPLSLDDMASSMAAAGSLVDSAQDDASQTSGVLDAQETQALRRALGDGTEGRAMPRGSKGVLNDLERQQKSRATRVKRDSLDRALLELAAFYRDVLILQVGARIELGNEDIRADVTTVAESSTQVATLRRLEAIMLCRERIAANVNPLLAVESLAMSLRSA